MENKRFNGKAIKMPKGKAGEYAKYSCNFYVGCSNGCTYCYLRKEPFKKVMGGNVPTLKKCFKDETHALKVLGKELCENLAELQKHGLFFTFTSDPMLPETVELTCGAIQICGCYDIPVKILTKKADFFDIINNRTVWIKSNAGGFTFSSNGYNKVAFGFTLTGYDDLEPTASTNAERIEAMRKLHDAGFNTWASIEPVIDLVDSYLMITETIGFCNLYKIGLESGKKYDTLGLYNFTNAVAKYVQNTSKLYFKDSLLKAAGINREDLPANCVTRDYDMFNE